MVTSRGAPSLLSKRRNTSYGLLSARRPRLVDSLDHAVIYCKLTSIYTATKRQPSLIDHPTVKKVAKNYKDATPAHVLLNWGLARGYSVIPKSTNPGKSYTLADWIPVIHCIPTHL